MSLQLLLFLYFSAPPPASAAGGRRWRSSSWTSLSPLRSATSGSGSDFGDDPLTKKTTAEWMMSFF